LRCYAPELAVSIEGKDAAEKGELLKKCAMTTLSSKLVGRVRTFITTLFCNPFLSLQSFHNVFVQPLLSKSKRIQLTTASMVRVTNRLTPWSE
jgi:hypothetical protein